MRYVEPVRPQKWICEENQRGEILFSFFSNRNTDSCGQGTHGSDGAVAIVILRDSRHSALAAR